jgi:hypothetical protein
MREEAKTFHKGKTVDEFKLFEKYVDV